MAEPIRVVVADDHPIVRSGLRREIERDPRCLVVGEANDGAAAMELIRRTKPEVAVVDLDMPVLDGFGVARAVSAERIAVSLLFLTMHDEDDMFHRAMQLGARGYILKDAAITEIVQAIKSVANGHPYVSAPLVEYLLTRQSRSEALRQKQPGLDALTASERRVLAMIADGQSSKQIGAALFIHYRTVENHRTNICHKLGIAGANGLLKFAIAHRDELL